MATGGKRHVLDLRAEASADAVISLTRRPEAVRTRSSGGTDSRVFYQSAGRKEQMLYSLQVLTVTDELISS